MYSRERPRAASRASFARRFHSRKAETALPIAAVATSAAAPQMPPCMSMPSERPMIPPRLPNARPMIWTPCDILPIFRMSSDVSAFTLAKPLPAMTDWKTSLTTLPSIC